MKIVLGIEYEGTHFNGWQAQTGRRAVQSAVETALSTVAAQPISVICAGRTDAGVHALEQVAHFETTANRAMRSWVLGGNVNLPRDVSILWAQPVEETFHARFSATARHYRYLILNRPTRPAIVAQRMTWEPRFLNIAKMQAAAQYLIGKHDFSAYRAKGCQAKSPIRALSRLAISRQEEHVILEVSANAFLQQMVRNIAGVLMTIGRGDAEPERAQAVLNSRDRAKGGVTAPPHGLYLSQVDYPAAFGLTRRFRADYPTSAS